MTPTEINGVACYCGDVFRRFTTWEDHRDDCEYYN